MVAINVDGDVNQHKHSIYKIILQYGALEDNWSESVDSGRCPKTSNSERSGLMPTYIQYLLSSFDIRIHEKWIVRYIGGTLGNGIANHFANHYPKLFR